MAGHMKRITDDMLNQDHDHVPRIRISVTLSNGDIGPDVTFKIKSTASLGYMIGYIEAVTNNGGSIQLSD